MVDGPKNGAIFCSLRRWWREFFVSSQQRATECISCIPRCPLLVKSTRVPRAIRRDHDISQNSSARLAVLPLYPSSSCTICVSTLGIPEGFCHAADNEQEIAPYSGCYHEYRLGLDGRPRAGKHCKLCTYVGVDAKKIKIVLPVSCCHRNTPVLEGQTYPETRRRLCVRRGKNTPHLETADMHCGALVPPHIGHTWWDDSPTANTSLQTLRNCPINRLHPPQEMKGMAAAIKLAEANRKKKRKKK